MLRGRRWGTPHGRAVDVQPGTDATPVLGHRGFSHCGFAGSFEAGGLFAGCGRRNVAPV
jgi:hypothetical protein